MSLSSHPQTSKSLFSLASHSQRNSQKQAKMAVSAAFSENPHQPAGAQEIAQHALILALSGRNFENCKQATTWPATAIATGRFSNNGRPRPPIQKKLQKFTASAKMVAFQDTLQGVLKSQGQAKAKIPPASRLLVAPR